VSEPSPILIPFDGRDMTLHEALVYALSLTLTAPNEALPAECLALAETVAEHMTAEEVEAAEAEAYIRE
jgi:hypothetical protein